MEGQAPKRKTFDPTTVGIVILLLIGVAGLWFIQRGGSGPSVEWQPFSHDLVKRAASEKRPVMIDFYASWCGPCKVLDRTVFRNPEVLSESQRFVRLRADVTDGSDPAVKKILTEFSIAAFPTVVFIGSDGLERSRLRTMGVLPAKTFVSRMKAVQ